MAEAAGGQKTAVQSYGMLGGVNQKASEYTTGLAQFLNLRNLDFDVPNALSKRPGSTQAISANSSGPLNSVFEFQRLDGSSWVVTGSDSAMFYRAGAAGLTLLSSGWNNGQPTDMLTFVNKLWMANGQKYEAWSGVGSSALPVGLPCSKVGITQFMASNDTAASWFLAGGATVFNLTAGASWIVRGVYFAYSYVRSDGYYGPADFLTSAQNTIGVGTNFTSGTEWFSNTNNFASNVGGFTVPSGYGISAVAVWVAVDSIGVASTQREYIPGLGVSFVVTGDLGWLITGGGKAALSATLKPGADLSRFHLYTLIAPGTFFLQSNGGVTSLAATLIPTFNNYTGIASGSAAFTGMNFCWFETNTPKFIDINQNVMFMSGFSARPSSIDFSDIGLPESIQPEYSIEVRTNDGDVIRGHKTYNNQTIVFKDNSFHKIIGVTPEEFELVELSTEYGCISDKTIVEYQEKLLFLDKKGIIEYNGASWDVISTPVEDIFRSMNLSAARDKACAAHQIYRNQVWFGIPINGSTQNNITVVYDYLVKAWTFFDGFNPASFGMVQGELSKPTVWMGNYSGVLRYFSESFYGDNGQGITCLAYSSWEHGEQNETWIWRRLFLDVASATGTTGTITGKLFSNYNTGTIQATFTTFQDAFQSRAEFGLPGKACAFEIAHNSASLPLLINGYTWARRFLRNV